MSYFRNVQNGGNWTAGRTYTFEVYEPSTIGGYGSCSDPTYGPGWDETGASLVGDINGYYTWGDGWTVARSEGDNLFNNANENDDGAVDNTHYDNREDMGGDWWKYTITIPAGLSNGIYYLKRATFHFCIVIW